MISKNKTIIFPYLGLYDVEQKNVVLYASGDIEKYSQSTNALIALDDKEQKLICTSFCVDESKEDILKILKSKLELSYHYSTVNAFLKRTNIIHYDCLDVNSLGTICENQIEILELSDILLIDYIKINNFDALKLTIATVKELACKFNIVIVIAIDYSSIKDGDVENIFSKLNGLDYLIVDRIIDDNRLERTSTNIKNQTTHKGNYHYRSI